MDREAFDAYIRIAAEEEFPLLQDIRLLRVLAGVDQDDTDATNKLEKEPTA